MPISHKREGSPSIRVAIVDEHRIIIDGLSALLNSRRNGMTVVAGEASWSAFLSNSEFPVDVAVLDLNLDDNVSLAAKIHILSGAGTRTIVMSRHTDPSSIYGAIRAGALAFIPKTDRADEVVKAIQAAALGNQYHNGSLSTALQGTGPTDGPGATDGPVLGRRELRALMLYASGRSIREVANDMGTTDETIKSYIKRARRKYRETGSDLGTKILLRRHAIREGWLSPE